MIDFLQNLPPFIIPALIATLAAAQGIVMFSQDQIAMGIFWEALAVAYVALGWV